LRDRQIGALVSATTIESAPWLENSGVETGVKMKIGVFLKRASKAAIVTMRANRINLHLWFVVAFFAVAGVAVYEAAPGIHFAPRRGKENSRGNLPVVLSASAIACLDGFIEYTTEGHRLDSR
jgi:hypothetical protein